MLVEQVWGRDLSGYDPDGLLPDIDPDVDGTAITRGCVCHEPIRWPSPPSGELAERKGLTIRQLVIEVTTRSAFVGSPATVAETIDRYVQATPLTVTSSSLTHLRIASTASSTTSSRCSRSAACFVPTTRVRTLRDHLGNPPPAGSRRSRARLLGRL